MEWINHLQTELGDEIVFSDATTRLAYSFDATPNYQAMPDAVVAPRSTEDVQAIMRLCQTYRVPVIARGSATNLAGGTTPLAGGLVMDFRHMGKILEIDEKNLTVTVEPGCITARLAEAVEARGLFYPPDPSSMKISTIGGNISENSGGLRGLKYGVTADYVLALEAVLPSGDVLKTGGKLAKDVAGYDLTRLLVGSEGTLAVITEATLKLIPLPETKQTMIAHFSDLDGAARTVSRIIESRIIPATLEFMDKKTIEVVEAYANIGLPTDVGALLLLEQDGPSEVVRRDIEAMHAICLTEGATHVEVARDEVHAETLRYARRTALSALARLRPTTILEDATVPRSEIAEMVRRIEAIGRTYDIEIATFGHAGDGNLHPTVATDARDHEEMERVEAAFADIFAAALELGGTITGEHGVGAMKAPYLEWKLGAAGIDVMKGIKLAFDPHGIMNPQKMFAKAAKKRLVQGGGV
ncbi:FAD-linked oxidase C-terminal domain-containing protein [Exiguobacterium sp.]|uniref:FAD-binding oxidoreductase n=1 Tax=Exiguobacterium sp. TaxID=44751 RepID=UPI00263A409C|nr:FAD-linked oxidase C-terminal domain-containing protein [Exiguobacterium sp.]MCC5891157.1 FAD-binding protein [Exiguobacterium sp.]